VDVPSMYRKCMSHADSQEWVVTEKVHGANLSINMTKKLTKSPITYALFRRNGPLQALETFYGCREVVAKLEAKLSQIFESLCSKIISGTALPSVTIFGELFGGHYPHPLVPGFRDAKFVQKGLWYCPEVQFCALDIAVDGNYLPFRDSLMIFRQSKLLHSAPLRFKTTSPAPKSASTAFSSYPFDQCIQWNVESFETTIPELLGLPKLPDNIAEGVVVRTLDLPRLLIKKNQQSLPKFLRRRPSPSAHQKPSNCLTS